MARKILLVSPTPTHPTNAGNRVRILNMVSYLMSQGHELHFLYSRQENADELAMKNFWGEAYFAVDYKKPELESGELLKRKILRYFNSHYNYYSGVDDHYNVFLDEKIRELHSLHHYDTVIAEYIFLSRAFLNFDKDVLKVLDTHDVMTDRHKLFLKQGQKPIWYSTNYRNEKKGVNRADVVIAIQEKEMAHFKKMTPRKVINVGHMVRISHDITQKPRETLLFVGSDNPSNHHGILEFLGNDFPLLKKKYPNLELLIAGNICKHLKQLPEGVRLLGELEDLSLAYDQADLVINPLKIGTGLKIKMIEAMGLSKLVFSTPVGGEGLESSAGLAHFVYNDSHELADKLGEILQNPEMYMNYCKKASETANDWNEKNAASLLQIFRDDGAKSSDSRDKRDTKKNKEIAFYDLKSSIEKDPSTGKFVVVSIPRSGSNLLVNLLTGHDEIICYSELFHKEAIYDNGFFERFGYPPYDIKLRNDEPASLS